MLPHCLEGRGCIGSSGRNYTQHKASGRLEKQKRVHEQIVSKFPTAGRLPLGGDDRPLAHSSSVVVPQAQWSVSDKSFVDPTKNPLTQGADC